VTIGCLSAIPEKPRAIGRAKQGHGVAACCADTATEFPSVGECRIRYMAGSTRDLIIGTKARIEEDAMAKGCSLRLVANFV
jgi:hypothetical protein